MFSDLSDHFNHPENALYALKRRLLAEGRDIVDMVSGNVTQHGIHFPSDLLAQALAEGAERSSTYTPDPLGHRSARDAISQWYADQGTQLPGSQIVMTPGTSFAYWYVFQLLANPGDDILCPAPNYPLFESIALTCGIKITSYPLREDLGWRLDTGDLKRAITPRTRAIVLISPHNPTGMTATPEELTALVAVARAHDLPVIVDEVFSPFMLEDRPYARLKGSDVPLLLTLNGFSKMLALAGLKIGWIGVDGHPDRVKTALRGLDALSDTFLPVADAAQEAVPRLLTDSREFQRFYRERIQQRAAAGFQAFPTIQGIRLVKPEGGFYTTLELPHGTDEETLAMSLLEREGVLAHPGYFYDLAGSHLVLSHVAEPDVIRQTAEKLARVIAATLR
jgi:alanine-synthesizing transaminase